MAAFDDIIAELWRAFDQGEPPPGRTATLTVGEIDIRLADRGKHVLARAAAGPVAAREPQRGAQVRAALQLSLGSLKRRPVLIHVKQDQDQLVLFVEQKIPYGRHGATNIERAISHLIKMCHAIKTDAQEVYPQIYSGNPNATADDESMENEVVFRI